jgi:hypothetical protein
VPASAAYLRGLASGFSWHPLAHPLTAERVHARVRVCCRNGPAPDRSPGDLPESPGSTRNRPPAPTARCIPALSSSASRPAGGRRSAPSTGRVGRRTTRQACAGRQRLRRTSLAALLGRSDASVIPSFPRRAAARWPPCPRRRGGSGRHDVAREAGTRVGVAGGRGVLPSGTFSRREPPRSSPHGHPIFVSRLRMDGSSAVGDHEGRRTTTASCLRRSTYTRAAIATTPTAMPRPHWLSTRDRRAF